MSSHRRSMWAVLAAGLVGAVLPAGPAHAYVAPAKQGFGGFSASSTATPLKLEIYEPTIPIPASPQAELSFAYTKTESATGPSASGRASWMWPGDPVGEGWKTFVEQLNLPEQLGEGGYRVQANSQTPGGPASESQEPFPGAVCRTSSSPATTVAKVGYSPDGDVSDQDPKSGGGGTPGAPVPNLPGAPVPAPGDLSSVGAAITGKQDTQTDSPTGPGVPPQLAALVDAGGMTSISRTVTGGQVIKSYATSKVTDLSLAAGLVTADSVKVASVSTSNGAKGTTDGAARVVGLAVGGNQFTIDRDGVHAAGRQSPIPGLPDAAPKALHELGISFALPKGERSTSGADAQSLLQGLQITIDAQVLRSKLNDIPFDEIVNAVPDQAGKLKSALGAAVHLGPKLVITAGGAATDVSTVPAIGFPDLSGMSATGGLGSVSTGGAVSGTGGSSSSGIPPAAGGSVGGAPAGASSPASSVATQNAAAGLPPLASLPGALLVGGLLLASGLGWWLQRIGGFVIGGAGSCSHGLETGVPDLRKA